MASAKVGSPMTSCHFSTGNWLVAMVERTPWRSSMISSRSRRFSALSLASPQSSTIRTSVLASEASSLG